VGEHRRGRAAHDGFTQVGEHAGFRCSASRTAGT
jgi:hypothetical protein